MDEDTNTSDSNNEKKIENYITGGTFGHGSSFGSNAKVEADIIADSVYQTSSNLDPQQLESFLILLDKLKKDIAETSPKLDEYQDKDLRRSLEVVEDHAKRPEAARDTNLLMQSLDKIRTLLVGVIPIAELANELWNLGQQIFGK